MYGYRILQEQKLITISCWDSVSLKEFDGMTQKIQSELYYSQDYDTIVDYTYLEHDLSVEETKILAKKPELNKSDIKIAVIAKKDLTYGMSRMYQMLSEFNCHPEMRVFRDLDAALTWLDRYGIEIESIFEDIRGNENN